MTTVRRYLRYLELSYQTLRLLAWAGNRAVRLIKAPKLVWFDLGVQRVLSGQLRGLTGERARRFLGDTYRCGVVVYRGDRIERLTETVFAVPDWWLLGFED